MEPARHHGEHCELQSRRPADRLAFGNGVARLYNSSGRLVANLQVNHALTVVGGFGKNAYAAGFSADSKLVAVGYADGTVGVFNGSTGAFENVIRSGTASVDGVSFLPGRTFSSRGLPMAP